MRDLIEIRAPVFMRGRDFKPTNNLKYARIKIPNEDPNDIRSPRILTIYSNYLAKDDNPRFFRFRLDRNEKYIIKRYTPIELNDDGSITKWSVKDYEVDAEYIKKQLELSIPSYEITKAYDEMERTNLGSDLVSNLFNDIEKEIN